MGRRACLATSQMGDGNYLTLINDALREQILRTDP